MQGKYHAPSMEGGHTWVFLNGAHENSDNFSVDSPHRIISLNNVAQVEGHALKLLKLMGSHHRIIIISLNSIAWVWTCTWDMPNLILSTQGPLCNNA